MENLQKSIFEAKIDVDVWGVIGYNYQYEAATTDAALKTKVFGVVFLRKFQ